MALSPTDKVDKVIVACRNFTQQPELFPRLDAMIKSAGGGVASTFFGNPDSGTPPQGSLEEMVMKLAVQHLTWQVSKNNRFARAVNEGTAQSGVESFLGRPGSEAAARIIPREAAAAIVDPTAAATTDAGIATQAGFFSGTVVDLSSVSQWQGMQPPGPTPVSFFSLKAGVTALGAAFGPTAHYGQYVSVALFDQHFEEMFKAVHGELNWAALAADRAFVEAYQQRMCEEYFIKQEVEFWMNQRYFSVQAALYVSYKLDKNSYAAVCDTWRRIITDVKPDVLAWASDLFDGIISGHALMAPLSTEFNINTPYANTVAEKCNAMEDHTSVIPGMSSPDPMNPLFVPPVITHDYTWGSAVESWLKRGDGPAAGDLPGLTTGTAPDNHERKVDVPTPFSGGGCFVPGTQVLLKGGKSKRIDQLSEGDRVVCDTGDNDRHDHHHRDQKHTPVLGLVSSEHVSIQLAKGSRVIGFNEFEPFFTAEHVFFTTTGLRAVDPLAAQKENDWLKVAPLRVGDVVLHTKDGHTYQHVRINTFTYALYSGPVYGVHLREGLRSYHANGFKVFLNYPEITLERMHKGISAMQPKDTTNLLRQLKEAGPLIDKALGFKLSTYLEHNAGMLHDLPKCLETAATERHLHRKKHGHPVKRNVHGRLLNPGVPLHAVRTMHFSLKHEDHPHVTSITTSRAADALAVAVPVDTHPLSVTLHQGHIMVDGVAPEHQRITEHEVHWSRPLTPDTPEGGPKGIWEHGAMKLASHRLSGFGAMFFTAGMDGPEVGIPKKFTVKGAMRYHTKHAAKPDADNAPEQPVPASAGNDWVAFPDIIIAPDDASGQLDAWLDIRDEDGSPLDASAFTTTFGFSDDNKMTVNITVDPSMIAIVPDKYAYIAYEAWFSYDSLSFGGYMWAYDTDKNENKGARYDWFGNVVPDPAPAVRPTPMMLFAAQPAAVVAPAPAPNGNDVYSNGNAAHSNGNHSNGAVPRIMALKAAAAVTAAAPTVRTFAEPHPMLFTATDTVLSLEALAAIPPPGNDITHKTNMNLMRNAMIWHLDDTTRKDFGMAQPETSSLACGGVDLTSIFTDDEKNMLVNKFGYGYISQIVALSTDDTLSKLYDSDEKKTVDNYMRGSGPGTLSSEKEYNTVNYKTSACTYMFLCKELSQYTTNGQDGKQWAQDFYNHLNNPLTLRGFVNQMRVIGGSEHVHHMCMILNALDPGSLLGQKLAGDIMRTQLSMTVGYVKNDQKDLNQLLVDIMRELITQVLSGQEFGDNTFLAGLASVTKDLMDEYAEEIKKSGKQAPEFMANTMSRMMNNFAAFMRYNKDIPWKAARDWIKSFKSNPDEIKPIVKNPDGSETVEEVTETRLQKIGRWAGYVAQAASVVMVMYFNIQGFLAWKDLNDWQRARLITNTTQVAFGVFRTIAEGTGLVDVSQPISNAAKDGLALNNGVSDAIATTPLEEQVPREAISVEAVEAEMPIESQVGRTAASADIVEGVARFKLGATVMRSINLAFLVAGAVFTGYEIANDVKGSPKFWLDVFSETAQGVVILTEVGALAIDMGLIAATTTLTSVLACTGAFAIVALVVIGIVSMFIHQSQDPPKSPAQIWVEGTGRNFLKPLAAQKKPDPPVLTDKTKLTYGNGNTEVSFTITPPSYVGADKDADGNMSKPYSLTGGYTLSITNSRDADNQPGIDLFKDALTFERKADGSPTDAKVTGLKPGYSYVFSVTCTNTAAEGSKVSDAATLVFTMPKNA